ncbi:MAG: hypothetical protein HOP15_08465 [Planctomycetes bacterium]|nr:hypothetical protein [Planctomycetota bacterium]
MLQFRTLGLTMALAALAALPATRQEPKPGNAWYEDEVDLGFKVKAPKDWEFVPGSPLERNLIGKYAAGNGQYINLGREAFVLVQVCLVKFDRRASASPKEERQLGDTKVELSTKGLANIEEWMTQGLDEGKQWHRVADGEALKSVLVGKVSVYEGTSSRGSGDPQPVRAYAAVFALSPEVDVALVGLGPGDKKKWRTFESAYQTLAKTLQPIAIKALATEPADKDPRSQKRAKLQVEVAKSPGWSLHETPNYFILSCYDDKGFIEELKLRLEAIRLVYENDYPPELARKITLAPPPEDARPGAANSPPPNQERTVSSVNALELGRTSVVRLCKDRAQYLQYGGGSSSSGYFSPLGQELVVYDDKANKGRDATWSVLNHEGFHQYTFAFFGNRAPHSWYNEGTGDYYSGFEFNLKTKRFTPKKNVGRQDNVLIIREDYVPLQEFVRWSKAKYYAEPEPSRGRAGKPMEGWACYAQGWSLIWFLRTGEQGKAKGWQKEWASILEKYVDTLLATANTDKAVDRAFEGIDWDAFEKSWHDYTM